jgi:hypothetical protein
MPLRAWQSLGVLVALGMGAMSACASTTPATMPGAVAPAPVLGRAPVLARASTPEPASTVGAFVWSAERRLTWADFQGPPDVSSEAVATTATLVDYQMSCTGDTFTWQIVSRFVPRGSWVKANHLMSRQSTQTLMHEQGHFDLSEVHARRARETLRRLRAPCALTDDEQNALIAGFHQQGHKLQVDYDRDTTHGTNLRRQQDWQERIANWLRWLPK